MRKFFPSIITIAVWSSLYHNDVYAKDLFASFNTDAQCLINVPTYNEPVVEGNIADIPVKIETDSLKGSLPNKVTYQGNVKITQGNRTLNADLVEIEQNSDHTHLLTVQGHVNYLDNFIKMQSDKMIMTIEKNDIEVANSQYHLVNRLGRGSADKMAFKNERYVILKNGNFTSCPTGDNSWRISGTTIIHDNKEQLLEAWNAVFKVGPVPIFYTPYLQYPTGTKRRSGLLMPSFDYNSIDGFNVAMPFYWNIAPNLDATITPRYIQRRGLQIQTETRYLTDLGLGTLAVDWLDHDSLYNENKSKIFSDIGENKQRWLFHWDHDGTINENWRIKTDATRVSDRQYLVDLNSDYAHVTDGYLTQSYLIGYANENWDASLSAKSFQVFRSALKDNVYRTEPQFDLYYYNNTEDALRLSAYGQIVNFSSSGKDNPNAIRLHLAPTVGYTLSSHGASLDTEATLYATHYYQDLSDSTNNEQLKKNFTRVLPKITIDGRFVLERNVKAFNGYTQTLEPRIKYQYIPYKDQSSVNNYDSSLMQSDYIGLFRDQMYSGLDRIASANQITTGVTSRLYDENLSERFNVSIGQVYYFNQSRTGDLNSPLDQNKNVGSLTWAMDSFMRINPDMIIRTGLQYDTHIDEIALANAIFEYKPNSDKLLQVSYRYANQNYINAIGLASSSPYKQNISQLGAMVAVPLNDSFSAVGSYYYDLDLKQTSDSFIGLQYNNCCWGFNILYGRKIVNWEAKNGHSEYKNKLSFNLELRGFGHNRNTTAKMLDFGLLPYRSALE